MPVQHLVRWGLFGNVGRFVSAEGARFARGNRVVCRTARGLEVGQVLLAGCSSDQELSGTLLRRATVEDELLVDRLERHKRQALRACQKLLDDRHLPVALVDAEHLFDGSLYFYFIEEASPELDRILEELTEIYDAEVQFRRFARTLVEGCGPGCGTDEAAGHGCGTSGCASCGVASACGTRQAR